MDTVRRNIVLWHLGQLKGADYTGFFGSAPFSFRFVLCFFFLSSEEKNDEKKRKRRKMVSFWMDSHGENTRNYGRWEGCSSPLAGPCPSQKKIRGESSRSYSHLCHKSRHSRTVESFFFPVGESREGKKGGTCRYTGDWYSIVSNWKRRSRATHRHLIRCHSIIPGVGDRTVRRVLRKHNRRPDRRTQTKQKVGSLLLFCRLSVALLFFCKSTVKSTGLNTHTHTQKGVGGGQSIIGWVFSAHFAQSHTVAIISSGTNTSLTIAYP